NSGARPFRLDRRSSTPAIEGVLGIAVEIERDLPGLRSGLPLRGRGAGTQFVGESDRLVFVEGETCFHERGIGPAQGGYGGYRGCAGRGTAGEEGSEALQGGARAEEIHLEHRFGSAASGIGDDRVDPAVGKPR